MIRQTEGKTYAYIEAHVHIVVGWLVYMYTILLLDSVGQFLYEIETLFSRWVK